MEFDIEQIDILIKLKNYLRMGGYPEEEKEIDHILCQYDSKNIMIKKQFLNKLMCLCHVRAYGDLYIPNIDYDKWISFLSEVSNVFQKLLSRIETQIKNLPISSIVYNGKDYDVFSDAVSWIQGDHVLVFLLKENEKYFQDNIVAVDFEGKYLWSSKDTINIENRDGAVFVSLKQRKKDSLHAAAWVGINYELDMNTGMILNRVITK